MFWAVDYSCHTLMNYFDISQIHYTCSLYVTTTHISTAKQFRYSSSSFAKFYSNPTGTFEIFCWQKTCTGLDWNNNPSTLAHSVAGQIDDFQYSARAAVWPFSQHDNFSRLLKKYFFSNCQHIRNKNVMCYTNQCCLITRWLIIYKQ